MNFIYNLILIIPRFFNAIQTKQELNRLKSLPKAEIHRSFKIGKNNSWLVSDSAAFEIAENVKIDESNFITVKKNARLKIGKNTYITRATISCLEEIEIGENCILGEGLKVFDHNHLYSKEPFSVSKTQFTTAKVKLGNNVWTGANCIILKGVTIGDNVILGAGCVVHKDVPENSIVLNEQKLVIKGI